MHNNQVFLIIIGLLAIILELLPVVKFVTLCYDDSNPPLSSPKYLEKVRTW